MAPPRTAEQRARAEREAELQALQAAAASHRQLAIERMRRHEEARARDLAEREAARARALEQQQQQGERPPLLRTLLPFSPATQPSLMLTASMPSLPRCRHAAVRSNGGRVQGGGGAAGGQHQGALPGIRRWQGQAVQHAGNQQRPGAPGPCGCLSSDRCRPAGRAGRQQPLLAAHQPSACRHQPQQRHQAARAGSRPR
jgi:hypothetical protein